MPFAAGSPLLPKQSVMLEGERLKVRYAELGDPSHPTLILLHGVPENLHAWYAVAPLLARRYHVLALDWPGSGGSDPFAATANYTSIHFADVIVDFMNTLEIRQASLVATDIALLPSFFVGLEHPSRVTKLVVMDGIPFPRPEHTSWELKAFANEHSMVGVSLTFGDATHRIDISLTFGDGSRPIDMSLTSAV